MARQSRSVASSPTLSRTKTTPIPVQRTVRRLDIRNLTSLPAGKMVPIAAWGLLREDSMPMSRFRINFEMMETVELLMNAVNVNVKAYLVPHLANERFGGSMDTLNRSYMKELEHDGSAAPAYVTTYPYSAADEILKYLGKHAAPARAINTAYRDAYNLIWNFRAANRSPDITPRLLTDTSLAKAFWQHQQFAHIVPDFDQALIEGEVPITGGGSVPVSGIGLFRQGTPTANASVYETGQAAPTVYPSSFEIRGVTSPVAGQSGLHIKHASASFPAIFAEMAEAGVTVSLANIELARKTQAFAVLRKQYTGHSDDYIIDLLMQGIAVPEQAWSQPMLLADRSTVFGMSKRYSTTADDLTASVVNGGTYIDLAITCPRCPTGGVVMLVAEISPEQLFERRKDAYLFITDPTLYPDFLRDTLDPEKVEIVLNEYIDSSHTVPNGTFGYAPLNHYWASMPPGIGGKFLRPAANTAFDEDRQRIWAVETVDPTLSEDFYLCTNMHTKPFVDTVGDPFEAVTRGVVTVQGNTVFGRLLLEATDDYEQVISEVEDSRIPKPAGAEARPGGGIDHIETQPIRPGIDNTIPGGEI